MSGKPKKWQDGLDGGRCDTDLRFAISSWIRDYRTSGLLNKVVAGKAGDLHGTITNERPLIGHDGLTGLGMMSPMESIGLGALRTGMRSDLSACTKYLAV